MNDVDFGDGVMVGEGVTDQARVAANLRAIDSRGSLSLELLNDRPRRDHPESVCRVGVERVRATHGAS